jgi:hypothetical protein
VADPSCLDPSTSLAVRAFATLAEQEDDASAITLTEAWDLGRPHGRL